MRYNRSWHQIVIRLLVATLLVGCAPGARIDTAKTRGLSIPWSAAKETKTLDVWMLDVGQGSCIYIDCPDGASAILVDCGTSSIGATSADAIADWVNDKMAAARTATVLVTHGHIDHLSMLNLTGGVNAAPVSKLMLGGTPSDYSAKFMQWANAVPTKYDVFGAGEFKAQDSRFQCGPAKVDLLTVNATELRDSQPYGAKKNADSAVIRLSYATHSVILPGDAEAITEQSAIANAAKNNLSLNGVSLVLGSHHGANTYGSNGQDWVDALRPHAAAFSAQIEFKHRHPRCAALTRYGSITDPLQPGFKVACGNGAQPSTTVVATRLLSTHENGHIRARITNQSIKYDCQKGGSACDGTLDPEEMP